MIYDWDAEDEHEAQHQAHLAWQREQSAIAEQEWEEQRHHLSPIICGLGFISAQHTLYGNFDGVLGITNGHRTIIDLSHNVPADLRGM